MILSIDTLRQSGAFTGAPVEKEISWKQGEKTFTATVYVRPLGYHTAVSDLLTVAGKADGVAARIAASICDSNGKPVFTPQDISEGPLDPDALAKDPKSTKRLGALDGNLTVALLNAVHEVTNLGKTKNSAS